jgi:hypothetical protein
MVPLFKRKVEFSYCDPRDIPPGLEVVASKTGNTVLMFRFFDSSKPAETLETLIFFFTI